jgi:lipopolysaccharide/colanic/teichoic acid biosynthesis glycosyltransferase
MVHEEFFESQFRSPMAGAENRPSGPLVLEPAVLNRVIVEESTLPSALGGQSRRAPSTAPAKQSYIQPWRAAAQAKGRPGYFLAKRCLDVVLAILALAVLSPVFLVIGLLVRFTSRGPALYRQQRIGYDGRPFVMYKFRSMYVQNDESLHRLAYEQFLRGERASGKVDGPLPVAGLSAETSAAPVKSKRQPSGDPRITRVGGVLRRTSLDELPQLLNVLKGDMSLVGPRPPIPYEVGLYQPWHLGRLDTVPGITGFWQVDGRGRVTFERMVQMDLEYIQKQSLGYDLKLLLQTIPAVLLRKGAV